MRASPTSDGLEGMPLKLVIIAVVMAISTPIIYGGLRAYEVSKMEGEMTSEANAIAELAQTLFIGGVGNAQSITVRLARGVTASVDYMTIGDSQGGPHESCIRCRIQGLQETTILVSGPSVPMRSSDGASFTILSGTHELTLECKSFGGGQYVEVRRA